MADAPQHQTFLARAWLDGHVEIRCRKDEARQIRDEIEAS